MTSLVSLPDDRAFSDRAQALLGEGPAAPVLTRLSQEYARKYLSSVSAVFTDLDGTIIKPGETELDRETKAAVSEADELGIEVVAVTGKPKSEVLQMREKNGENFPLRYLYEKGAFALVPDGNGGVREELLLATAEMVAATTAAREYFITDLKEAVEESFASERRIRLELAGNGDHQCLLSIDILDPTLISGDFRAVPDGRMSIKIQDQALVTRVAAEVHQRLQHCTGFETTIPVDLGNANIEFAPGGAETKIEKDLGVARYLKLPVEEDGHHIRLSSSALTETPTFAVLGDSGNDRSLFSIAKQLPRAHGHLVYHPHTPKELLEHCTFLSSPICSGAKHLQLIIAAKREATR
ncbi:HAD hydrolase family protein [bacterium]|nr:HAD hydrolase family protein [bacterium]